SAGACVAYYKHVLLTRSAKRRLTRPPFVFRISSSRLESDKWYLLRQTVQGAQPTDNGAAVHGHDRPLRKTPLQDLPGRFVAGIAVGRHEYQAVGDVEVRIGGRHALAGNLQRLRHGQFNDLQRTAVREPK